MGWQPPYPLARRNIEVTLRSGVTVTGVYTGHDTDRVKVDRGDLRTEMLTDQYILIGDQRVRMIEIVSWRYV